MISKRLVTSHLFFTMVLAAQLSSGPASAAVYEVTNISNSGIGSLRQAVSDANSNPGPDTITFAASINGMSIDLLGDANEDSNASGDLDILNGGDLTIQGNGAANTIIDGGGIDRVFHICPGGGCANSVTFIGVTVRNGRVVGGHGGGIYNKSDTTLAQSKVIDNTAKFGGGIYNRGQLTVRHGSLIGATGAGNTATDSGGGICNVHASVTLEGSTVTANVAKIGGGIYNYINSKMTVDGSTVSANTVNGYGGGIHNEGTLKVLNGSTIGKVGAGNKSSFGGGISNESSGTITINRSIVSANRAACGGGIFNEGALNVLNDSIIGGADAANMVIGDGDTLLGQGGGIYNSSMVIVRDSVIRGNISTDHGGGISNSSTGMLTLDGSSVSANAATAHGGGIFNQGTLNILNGSLIGEVGAGNKANRGGGISNGSSGTTTVDSSIVSANTSQYGGGFYNWGKLSVTNSTIGGAEVGNQATIWGGGIYNLAGYTTVKHSCILNNRATINGGGLFNDMDSFAGITVTGSNIVGNSTTSFFNNQGTMQSATGNWWGATSGPNSPGADTVDGNVDTSDFLKRPIPCLKVGPFPWPLFLPAIIGKERP